MKMIEAIIKPFKLEEVKDALLRFGAVPVVNRPDEFSAFLVEEVQRTAAMAKARQGNCGFRQESPAPAILSLF